MNKLMRALVLFLAILTSLGANAGERDLSKSFPLGSGARYTLITEGDTRSDLIVSSAESQPKSLRIEYYMKAKNSPIPIELWQQFRIELPASGPLKVTEGYVFNTTLKNPEKLPDSALGGFDGVLTSDFLFSDPAGLAKLKKGEEMIDLPAATGPGGKVKATRFEQDRNGQKVVFWISEEAKPISMIKLISTGPKPEHKYQLILEALVQNVKARIDPAQAGPLTDAGRLLTALPTGK